MSKYKYSFHDERGEFSAYVEDEQGNTVWNVSYPDYYENVDGELIESSTIFEDGFMKDANDIEGLENYLKSINILKREDELMDESGYMGDYADGGSVEEGNLDMVKNQVVQVEHHAKELMQTLKSNPQVDAWVVAKMDRATSNLSDITHYLEGEENSFAYGGVVQKEFQVEFTWSDADDESRSVYIKADTKEDAENKAKQKFGKAYEGFKIIQIQRSMETGGTLEKRLKKKLSESFELPMEVAVYVPSTQKANEIISKKEFNARIEEVETYLSNLFGGYSATTIDGGYISDDKEKGLIQENVARVASFGSKDGFEDKFDELRNKISEWCNSWSQESIALEFEGDMFYIDAKAINKLEKGGEADSEEEDEEKEKENERLEELMEEYDLPAEVIQEYASNMGIEINDITDLPFNGRFDSEEDFAEDLVEQGVVNNLSYYLEMTSLDIRLLAGEEADNRVEDMTDEDLLKAMDMEDEANEYEELEDEIYDLENDVDDLKSKLDDYMDEEDDEMTEGDIEMREEKAKELRDEIGEKESELENLQNKLASLDTYDEVVDKAREELRDVYYDDVRDELEKDAVGYFVDSLGYAEEDLAKNSSFSVDYEKLAKDLSYDYTIIEHGGDVYVFSSYMDGGYMAKGGEVVNLTTSEKNKLRNIFRRLDRLERTQNELDEFDEEQKEIDDDINDYFDLYYKFKSELIKKYGKSKDLEKAINKIVFDYGYIYADGGMTYAKGGIIQDFEIYDEQTGKSLFIKARSLDEAEGISETIDFDDYENGDIVDVLDDIDSYPDYAKGGRVKKELLSEEHKQFIREESQEAGQGYTYRYKVLRGQDILLKEKNNAPVQKWYFDYENAIEIAKRLNKVKGNRDSKMAQGGKVKEIDYANVFPILKDKIDNVIDDIPYEYANGGEGEEVEYKSRDGFFAYTDGGYEYRWFEYVSMISGSGKSLPTKPLDAELNRQVQYNYDFAKENFIEKYPQIVEKLGEDKINYSDLQDAGYDSEAEELSEMEMDYSGEDSIMMRVFAYYYSPENRRGENGKHTISLFGDVNLESPYHRAGNLDDSIEITFTFNSLDELSKKMDSNLIKIVGWFNGDNYNNSKKEMKVRRMADGGKMSNYGIENKFHEEVRDWIYENAPVKYQETSLDEIPRSVFTPNQLIEVDAFMDRFNSQSYADGGRIDLFEDYENIPDKVQVILDRYSDEFGGDGSEMDYKDTRNMLEEVESVGYTFGYSLDNEPYGLRPIGVRLNELKGFEDYDDDDYAKGGTTDKKKYLIEFYETLRDYELQRPSDTSTTDSLQQANRTAYYLSTNPYLKLAYYKIFDYNTKEVIDSRIPSYAKGGGVEWDKDSDSIRAEMGEFKIMITPQNERGYYDVNVKANNKTIGNEYDVFGIYNAKNKAYEIISNSNKFAHGGKTQGYDDREDERLAMKYGKMSGKDLNSTKARRDDARFEERGKMAKGGEMESYSVEVNQYLPYRNNNFVNFYYVKDSKNNTINKNNGKIYRGLQMDNYKFSTKEEAEKFAEKLNNKMASDGVGSMTKIERAKKIVSAMPKKKN